MDAHDPLYMWTVYDHPLDYPAHYVVRRFAVHSTGKVTADKVAWSISDTLEQARASVPPDRHCLPRAFDDDSKIVETWL